MGSTHGHHSSRLTRLQLLFSVRSANSKDQLSSRYGTISWEDQPVTWCRLATVDHFCCGKNTLSILEWILVMGSFPASAKTVVCGLIECLIHHHGILPSIASEQGTLSTAREVLQVGPHSRNSLILSNSPPSRQLT